jgi:hypothetical protein
VRFGLALDSEGNVFFLRILGVGGGFGDRLSLGVSFSYSGNAQTNNDLSDQFTNVSAGAAAGPSLTADAYYGTTKDGRLITGSGGIFGAGVGASFSVTTTNTVVTPLFNVKIPPKIDTAAYNIPWDV